MKRPMIEYTTHRDPTTIHPGFVDTEAVKDAAIPAPNEISESAAV